MDAGEKLLKFSALTGLIYLLDIIPTNFTHYPKFVYNLSIKFLLQ